MNSIAARLFFCKLVTLFNNFKKTRDMKTTDSNTVVKTETPLGLKQLNSISKEQLNVVRKIENYSFPYVRERIIEKRILPEDVVDEAIYEFRKFFALFYLVSGEVKSLGIPSKAVDEVWHNFILFTRLYTKFCKETVGKYMHHKPGTSYTPINGKEAADNFRKYYRVYFGELPSIWTSKSWCDSSACDSTSSQPSTGDSEWEGGDELF